LQDQGYLINLISLIVAQCIFIFILFYNFIYFIILSFLFHLSE